MYMQVTCIVISCTFSIYVYLGVCLLCTYILRDVYI